MKKEIYVVINFNPSDISWFNDFHKNFNAKNINYIREEDVKFLKDKTIIFLGDTISIDLEKYKNKYTLIIHEIII